jgi:hypothetical protein
MISKTRSPCHIYGTKSLSSTVSFSPTLWMASFSTVGLVSATLTTVVCIDGLDAVEVEEVLESPPDAPEPEPQELSTGSLLMDDVLEHSQLRMLETIADLAARLDRAARRTPSAPEYKLDGLTRRIAAIEKRQRSIVRSAEKMREGLRAWQSGSAHVQVGE